jgi:hypothetical protein
MKIESQIMNAAIEAVKALYGQDVPEKMVQLQKTRSEFEGNLTLVVFPFLMTFALHLWRGLPANLEGVVKEIG